RIRAAGGVRAAQIARRLNRNTPRARRRTLLRKVRSRHWVSMTVGGLLLAFVLAACGSSSSSTTGDPLSTALSYVPSRSPLLVTITTDPNSAPVKNLSALL